MRCRAIRRLTRPRVHKETENEDQAQDQTQDQTYKKLLLDKKYCKFDDFFTILLEE